MTDDLKKLAEAAEAVAPSPWKATSCLDVWVETKDDKPVAQTGDIHWLKEGEDATAQQERMETVGRFIAAAHPAAILDLYRERDEARERAERFEKLDREAATYVESVIAMRTDFTGEPPYVGWKGLGLALTEALNKRDAAEAALAAMGERGAASDPDEPRQKHLCQMIRDGLAAGACLAIAEPDEDGFLARSLILPADEVEEMLRLAEGTSATQALADLRRQLHHTQAELMLATSPRPEAVGEAMAALREGREALNVAGLHIAGHGKLDTARILAAIERMDAAIMSAGA